MAWTWPDRTHGLPSHHDHRSLVSAVIITAVNDVLCILLADLGGGRAGQQPRGSVLPAAYASARVATTVWLATRSHSDHRASRAAITHRKGMRGSSTPTRSDLAPCQDLREAARVLEASVSPLSHAGSGVGLRLRICTALASFARIGAVFRHTCASDRRVWSESPLAPAISLLDASGRHASSDVYQLWCASKLWVLASRLTQDSTVPTVVAPGWVAFVALLGLSPEDGSTCPTVTHARFHVCP